VLVFNVAHFVAEGDTGHLWPEEEASCAEDFSGGCRQVWHHRSSVNVSRGQGGWQLQETCCVGLI